MDSLFTKLKDGELVLAVPKFALKGKAKYVFAMLQILATTRALEDDVYWWALRADLLSRDRDTQYSPDVGVRVN